MICCARKGDSGQREVCDGDHKISKRILEAAGFDSDDLIDMFAVLKAQGACCDCEVLYNVVESSRLKVEYWKRQAHDAKAKSSTVRLNGRYGDFSPTTRNSSRIFALPRIPVIECSCPRGSQQ
jgi:uncharacterized protein DUF2695